MPASPWSRCATRTPRWRTWMWPSRPTTRARGPQGEPFREDPGWDTQNSWQICLENFVFFLAKMRMNIQKLPEQTNVYLDILGWNTHFSKSVAFFAIPSPRHDWTCFSEIPWRIDVGRRFAARWSFGPRSSWTFEGPTDSSSDKATCGDHGRQKVFAFRKVEKKIDAQNWHEAVFIDLEEHSSSSIPDIPDIPRLYG